MFHLLSPTAKNEVREITEMIHDALESAKQYYMSSLVATEFVDNNLCKIVQMLLSLSTENLRCASHRVNVERSIRFALQLVIQDLRMRAHKFTVKCPTVMALVPIFDHKEAYYGVNHESRMDKLFLSKELKVFTSFPSTLMQDAAPLNSLIGNWFIEYLYHHTNVSIRFVRMLRGRTICTNFTMSLLKSLLLL